MSSKPRLLCVDDESDLLDGLRLALRKSFSVTVATSGADGLAVFQEARADPEQAAFSAVVSDMRMPNMNGAEFLSEILRLSPATPRILLSGQADLESTIAAINDAKIFRFLTKPCDPALLIETVHEAMELERLRNSERILLSQTLRGAVSMLTDVLGIVSVGAYSRTMRIREIVMQMNAALDRDVSWNLDVATLLSQVGCVVVPDGPDGRPQPDHGTAAANLLQKIPRLEPIAGIIHRQQEAAPISDEQRREAWSAQDLDAELLRAAVAFDARLATGAEREDAIEALGREATPPPKFILRALAECQPQAEVLVEVKVMVKDLVPGMQLLNDLHTSSGALLAGGSTTLTAVLIVRIRSFAKSAGIDEPITVMAPQSSVSSLRVAQ